MTAGNSVGPAGRLIMLVMAMSFIAAACTLGGSRSPAVESTTVPWSAPASPGSSATPDRAGCPVVAQEGLLRSNTLLNMTVDSDGASDRVTFVFGPMAPGPTGGTGRLAAAAPPFSQAGSGATVEVLGTHFVVLRLDGMLVADDAGNALYQGPASLRPAMVAIKDIEQTDGFEGVYSFVIGYDGNGCVGLAADAEGGTVTITVGH